MSDISTTASSATAPALDARNRFGSRPVPQFRAPDTFVPSSRMSAAPLQTPPPPTAPAPASAAPAPPASSAGPVAAAPASPAPQSSAAPAAKAPGASGSPAADAPKPAQGAADVATKQKAIQDDVNQAQTIYAQMQADRTKAVANMQKIWADALQAVTTDINSTTSHMIEAFEKAESGFIGMLEG